MMFGAQKLLVGVIHLPPLPGYPESPGMDAVVDKALADLRALETGPVEAVLVENENDKPHHVAAARETIAAMTPVTTELVAAARHTKVGVEILLNDPMASLAVAHMADASFIRTDYFVDAMERPEHGGRVEIDAEGLMRYRTEIGADAVLVLADIQVKYARMLETRTLTRSAELACEKGADAIVVTGTVTGEPPTLEHIQQAQKGADRTPVLIGSGLNASNAPALLAAADGAIVSTSLKRGSDKVKELVDARRLCR